MRASVAWGLLVWLVTETLNIFQGISASGLITAWSVIPVALLSVGYYRKWFHPAMLQVKQSPLPELSPVSVLVAGSALAWIAVGVVAFRCPPNTPDAMLYHMPRVLHWLQNGNIEFYSTNNWNQLFMPPWAEFQILHFTGITGSDRLANLGQWMSMAGCGVAVSLIARELGGSAITQSLAALLSMTLPQGMMQASGAKNDYVLAFWLAVSVFFLLRARHEGNIADVVFAGCGFALAVLTKSTAWIFGPIVIGSLLVLWFLQGRRQFVLRTACVLAIAVLLINARHALRTYDLCGSPLGCSSGDGGAKIRFANDTFGPRTAFSNLIRNVALHFRTSNPSSNQAIADASSTLIRLIGKDPNDRGDTWFETTFQLSPLLVEDVAGDPLHLLLFFAAGLLLFIRAGRFPKELAVLIGGIALSFLLLCVYLRWTPWMTRLHHPLFVMASAVVPVVLAHSFAEKWLYPVAAILLSVGLWTVAWGDERRPLFGTRGVLARNWEQLYGGPRVYRTLAQVANATACREIGVDAEQGFYDYPLMQWLRTGPAPRRLDHVYAGNASAKYSQRPVMPCALICGRCTKNEPQTAQYVNQGFRPVVFDRYTYLYRADLPEPVEALRLAVAFYQLNGANAPLVAMGSAGAGDFLLVKDFTPAGVRLAYDHWGRGGPVSEPITVEPDREYTVEFAAHLASQKIVVTVDGRQVLEAPGMLYFHTPEQVYLGSNPIGGGFSGTFSGSVRLLAASAAMAAGRE